MDTRLSLLPLDLRRELEHYTRGVWFRAKTDATYVYLEDMLFVEPGKPEAKISAFSLLRDTIQNHLNGALGVMIEEPYRIITHTPAPRELSILDRDTIITYSSDIYELFLCKLKTL